DQKFRVRSSNIQRLGIRFSLQASLFARSQAQQRIKDGALLFRSDLDCFVNSSVFRRFGNEYLIKAQTQKVAKIDIYVPASNFADPKVEQSEVSQDAVEKFKCERAIGRSKRGLGERF